MQNEFNKIQNKALICSYCNNIINFNELINKANEQYILLFFGTKEHDLCGMLCPNCNKIFINIVNKEYNEYLLSYLASKNRAKPIYYHTNDNLKSISICELDDSLYLDLENKTIIHDIESPNAMSNEIFYSYKENCHILFSESVNYILPLEEIYERIDKENRERKKVMPRYYVHDNNWINLQTLKRRYLGIDSFYENIDVNHVAKRTTDEYRIRLRHDFLNIVSDRFNHLLKHLYFCRFDTIEALKLGILNKQDYKNLQTYRSKIKYLWSHSSDSDIVNMLDHLASSFLHDYNRLSSSIDTTYAIIKKFIGEYSSHVLTHLNQVLKRNLITKIIPVEVKQELEAIESEYPYFKVIVTQNYTMIQLKISLARIAMLANQPKLDLLLLGEPGTGKELFARAIHQASGRKGEFVALNCAAIPPHLFESELFGHVKGAFTDATKDKKGATEQAKNGTLFLDEIGELLLEHQSKLLRCIEEREIRPVGMDRTKKIDVRFVFATNRDLMVMVSQGDFREDLYQRISGLDFRLPPLRERRDDIPILVKHFIQKYDTENDANETAGKIDIEHPALDFLCQYEWKTGVRELENCIRRAVIIILSEGTKRNIKIDDLELVDPRQNNIKEYIKSKKRKNGKQNTKISNDDILYWMDKCNRNQSEVARKLGVSRKTIQRRLKSLSNQ